MRFVLLVGVVTMCGCATPFSMFHKVSASIKTPSVLVKQTGDAAQPATVTTSTTKTEAPIPAGSRITIETPAAETKGPVPMLTTTTTAERIVGPAAYAPPLGPTPSDIAGANLKIWFWVGLVIGSAAALFGLVRGWNLVMWGGICVASACALAIFVQTSPLVFALLGVGVALKLAGPYIWHTQIKQVTSTTVNSTVPIQP